MGDLDAMDQIVLLNVGDLPVRTVLALLKVLGTLRDHNVGLYLSGDQSDTGNTSFALLDMIDAFRRAKMSQAIRAGQAKAVATGQRIGRPAIPAGIRDRIRLALAQGGGVRPTADRFQVSPASVINIRRTMTVAERVGSPSSCRNFPSPRKESMLGSALEDFWSNGFG